MKTGDKLHGFRVDRMRELPEIRARLWYMTHEKSGAALAFLDREDENKTFSIAFKTIPEDSTGVFHILEHSVLCGSDRFPVKEPFVELLKTSVQTFLNAMTYPDKTVYPVSSRNDQDLLNLTEVYLDAVLHPAITHKPEIFRQEGWRYEFNESGGVGYQGVVFNEMKGAYASPDAVLESGMMASLFPDTCYRFESGGYPADVPDLSYEAFLANHRKFYHPSNARISLCGSVNLDSMLPLIDRYLSFFDKKEIDFDIAPQTPAPRSEKTLRYEIGADEEEAGKTIAAGGSILCDYNDRETIFAATILADYLADDNASPLKNAVLRAGLGQDLRVSVQDGLRQVPVVWEVWNTDPEKIPAVRERIRQTVSDLVKNGLDRGALRASYNRFAFRLRDRDGTGYPRSLGEALTMLDTWLYGGDPADALLAEDALASLESKLDTGYFEDLLSRLFLDESHTAFLTLLPSRTLGEEKRAAEEARVQAEAALWTEEDRARLRREAAALAAWQQTPDSEEALASIPMLRLGDLKEKPEPLPVRAEMLSANTVLRHEVAKELTYLDLHFNSAALSPEELPFLSLLPDLLGRMATGKRCAAALQQALKQTVGKFSAAPAVYSGQTKDRAKILFSVRSAFLPGEAENAAALLAEILTDTRFDDLDDLFDIVRQEAMDAQLDLASSGHRYAVSRAGSHFTARGAAQEIMNGLSFVSWLKRRSKEEDRRALAEALARTAKKVFVRQNLTLSTNADELAFLRPLADAFPEGQAAPEDRAVPVFPAKSEGAVIPAAIGFASKSVDPQSVGSGFCGSQLVLANVLNFRYLWNEVRVKGGAYGCGFSVRDGGDAFYYSYRDPKPGRSLEIYDRAPVFLREFLDSSPDLTGAILASVSSLDPLLSAEGKIAVAESRWFKGTTEADIERYYSELIHTSAADLKAALPLLEALAAEKSACVFAGQDLIDACGDRLEERLAP